MHIYANIGTEKWVREFRQCRRVKAASITGLSQPANSPTPRSGANLPLFIQKQGVLDSKTAHFGLKNSAFLT
jgi:hypothetical protein